MKLKKQFATHGVPRLLISDNGPQFKLRVFSNFAKLWGFEHITSSPRYPQSNGLAERAVQSAKNVMTKCAEDNTDPYLALLLVRNTQDLDFSHQQKDYFLVTLGQYCQGQKHH